MTDDGTSPVARQRATRSAVHTRALAGSAGAISIQVNILANLCSLLRIQGRFEEALENGREGLEIARALEAHLAEGAALSALGDVHTQLGDLVTAETIFEQLATLGQRQGAGRFAAWAAEGQAHISLRRGDWETARLAWERAVDAGAQGVLHLDGAQAHLKATATEGMGKCWRCRSSVEA